MKNSVADPFPCPEKEWVFKRPFSRFIQSFFKATPHKARLTALHAICVQIFRHIAQKSLAIRQYACGISGQSAEKSDNAPYAQALCGVA